MQSTQKLFNLVSFFVCFNFVSCCTIYEFGSHTNRFFDESQKFIEVLKDTLKSNDTHAMWPHRCCDSEICDYV